ncbi:MAG: hypothetical protein WC826_02495 [Microgenomates group bacterium]|jgi:hypothetical protein
MIRKLKRWEAFVITLIVINVFLSTWWLINGDIHYDVDIARDFLVLKEIIDTGKLTLIGPHSGIVGGLFHGPLWYYINLPAFFITQGDPVLMGWFWWGLSIITLLIFWFVTKKLFNSTIALLATLLYSANSIINPTIGLKQFYNPYGAVVLSPVFFYFFIKYLETKKALHLLISILILGCIIQFQMAFGIPVLIMTTLFLIYFLFSKKLLKHLLILPIIPIPLSTYIIFELKHEFLQTKSVITFITSQHPKVTTNFSLFLYEKIFSLTTDTFFAFTQDSRLLSCVTFLLFVLLTFKVVKGNLKKIYLLFLYFYFGFWAMFLLFNISWTTYYWPFLPVIIILYTAFYNYLPKKIFFLIFVLLLAWNYFIAAGYIKNFNLDVTKRSVNSWAFNKYVAESVYKEADQDFGYYIYTPYLWVYNQWYALSFVQREYRHVTAYPFTKQRLTFLVFVDVNSGLFNTDSNGWKVTHIKINKEPESIKTIDVIDIQKYRLTDEEIKIPANPYLLNSTFFR